MLGSILSQLKLGAALRWQDMAGTDLAQGLYAGKTFQWLLGAKIYILFGQVLALYPFIVLAKF